MEESNEASEQRKIAAALMGFSSLLNNERAENEKIKEDSDILNGAHLMLNAVNNMPSRKEKYETSPMSVIPPNVDIEQSMKTQFNSPGQHLNLEEFTNLFNNALQKVDETRQIIFQYDKSLKSKKGRFLSPLLIEYLINVLNIKENDILYILGSGIGDVLMQIASRTNCKCFGSENKDYEYFISTHIYKHIDDEITKNNRKLGEVHIYHSDPFDQIKVLKESTLILIMDNIITNENKSYMENVFLKTLKHESKVVTFKELFSPSKVKNKRFASLFNYDCVQYYDTHTKSKIYVYTVDRDKIKRNNIVNSDFSKKMRSSQSKIHPHSNPSVHPLNNYIRDGRLSDKIDEFVSVQNLNSHMLSLVLFSCKYDPIYLDDALGEEKVIEDTVPLFAAEFRKKCLPVMNYSIFDRENKNVNDTLIKIKCEEDIDKQKVAESFKHENSFVEDKKQEPPEISVPDDVKEEQSDDILTLTDGSKFGNIIREINTHKRKNDFDITMDPSEGFVYRKKKK